MFTASFYFLGLAVFILATSVCLSWAKRAGKFVEMEVEELRTVSVCLPMVPRDAADRTTAVLQKELSREEKVKWNTVRSMWFHWYCRCQNEAVRKQHAMYSWARTMALSAALCLVGVILEAEFDQPITFRTVLMGFRRPTPVTANADTQGFHAIPAARLSSTNR